MTFPDSSAYPLMPDAKTLKEYGEVAIQNGLTKRELFAAMIFQGIISNNNCTDDRAWTKVIACDAVASADALIAELNKEVQS